MVHILHTRKGSLLLVVGGDVRGARLIQATGTLESLVIGPVLRRVRSLPLARAVLQ